MEIRGGQILGHATTVEVYEENSSFPAGVYMMRTGKVSVGYGGLTLWVLHPHLKAWLMILTPQILRRHGSPLQSEVYMELTQLELMINDICWGPPGTHLSKIKVFVNALSLACVSLCNELCLATRVRGGKQDLLFAPYVTLTRYYCRIKYNHRNVSAQRAVERAAAHDYFHCQLLWEPKMEEHNIRRGMAFQCEPLYKGKDCGGKHALNASRVELLQNISGVEKE